MFFGQYEHTIDDKGRLTIPSRYRDLLQDGAYITQGFDQNLMVLTATTFDRVSNRVSQMSMTDPTARQLRRLIFSNADRVEVDRAGRILIPQFLRASAQLDGAAVMVGVGEYIEIWSPSRWQEQNSTLQDGEANAQRFAALDLW
jgi:MraZ protein